MRSTGIAKRLFFYVFCFGVPSIYPLNRYFMKKSPIELGGLIGDFFCAFFKLRVKKKEGDYFFMAKPRRTPLNCLEMSPIVEREVLPLRALTV